MWYTGHCGTVFTLYYCTISPLTHRTKEAEKEECSKVEPTVHLPVLQFCKTPINWIVIDRCGEYCAVVTRALHSRNTLCWVSYHCVFLKPVLNWANVCSPEHTSDTSTNYDSFPNWTFRSPNMVRTVQTLLDSQLACNEMQASARTCGRRAADSMIEKVG